MSGTIVAKAVARRYAKQYRCGGNTPLYDTIGRGIGILHRALSGKPGKAALVIMTDGQEDSSREFSHEKITDLIKSRQERGWVVTFLGEGLDVAISDLGGAAEHLLRGVGEPE